MTVFESGLPGLSATPTTSSFYIDGRGFRATKGNGVKHHFSALLTASASGFIERLASLCGEKQTR
jgi:hypothetical protein